MTHMKRIATDSGASAGQRLSVVAAVWTLIAVILLSALAPLGPPLSRVAGSAFNPATIDVVIKARAPLAPQAVQATQPDGEGPLVPLLLLAAFAAALVILWRQSAASAFAPVGERARSGFHSNDRRARAPPASS